MLCFDRCGYCLIMLFNELAPMTNTIQQEKEKMNEGIEINLERTNSQFWQNTLQTGEGPHHFQVWSPGAIRQPVKVQSNKWYLISRL